MQSKIRLVTSKSFVAAATVISVVCMAGTAQAQPLLDPTTLTKFVDLLPNPLGNVISPVGTLDGMDLYEVSMTQFTQQLHRDLDPTTVWGYNGTYPGPTFDVQRDEPIKVNWINSLVDGGGAPLPHLLPLDTTVHGAGPQFAEVRTVVHLHGGVIEPESDGFPEHWFTADPNALANGMGGPAGNSALYTYHNEQPSTTLWYHDHGMGITRLNVYAGLAGFYLLRDAEETALNLPGGDYEVPIVLQDRMFYEDGQLFYPRGPGDLTDPGGSDPLAGLPPEFPSTSSVVPHFFGDINLVNGKVWPFMEVEPRKYRFRLVNGSNSRFYDLQLDALAGGSLTFHQIGSDGGLLEARTDRNQVLMAPAERADVIVDFSSLGVGEEVILRNFGPDGPFEFPGDGHTPADPDTTGQVMKFRVVPSTGPDTSTLPDTLVSVPRIPESDAVITRQLSLVEELDEFGRPKLLLDGAQWTDPMTELPVKGTTEIWEITNSTADSHPIHLHLVQFQVLDRVSRQLGEIPLEPYELGWKDTIAVNRRETVRVIAKFEDFEGLYVWHCHILEHEDHEMMRAYEVVPGPELVVEQGVTLELTDPHTVPSGYILTVDGTLTTPQVDVVGLLRGTGQVLSNVINDGTVSPGASPGRLSVSEFTQVSGGSLQIELAGTDNSDPQNLQFDQLLVSGNATLDGTLDVSLISPFALSPGQSFDIMEVGGSLTGTFSGLTEGGFVGNYGGTNLFISYLGGDGHDVTLLSALPGDYDLDGDVDGMDFLKWQWGESPFSLSRSDLTAWKANFGAVVPLAQPLAAVPEPTGASLLAVALGIVSCCGLRRGRCLAKTSAATTRDPFFHGTRKKEFFEIGCLTKRLVKLSVLLPAVVAMFASSQALGTLISLTPSQDNTLYETADGSKSNGEGSYLFAGKTDVTADKIMRAVLAFDVAASVPAGSVIQSVSLSLEMNRTQVGAMPFDLHRLTSDWGEGTSNANGPEGAGKNSTTDDATWKHTFYPDSFWTTLGGDFDSNVSGSASVGDVGSYTWASTAQMVADVQDWLDTPANNYGWILKGPEGTQSAKRFHSREHNDAATRPALEIEFVSGGPEVFNWIGTGNGGSFHDNANWDTNQAPSSSTDIVNLVNTELTDQVATLASSVTVDDLTINGNTNSMTLSIGQGLAANVGDLQIGSLGGLAVELATGASGQLNASGPAALAGTLALSTPGGTPTPTESFEFLTYDSRTGIFDRMTGQEIEPGRGFSLHYNDDRALAIAGQWAASGEELTGDVDVLQELLVSGAWDWNGTLIKRGAGDLVLDLDGGFLAGNGATLAIVDGTVRLHGTGQVLSLDALTFGELGQLSGIASLAGEYGWYGNVVAVPEPGELAYVAVGLLGLISCHWRFRVHGCCCLN